MYSKQFSHIKQSPLKVLLVWERETDPELGTYNVGDSVSGNIGAYSEEVPT